MPGFNTIPVVGGGGGQANMTYVASVHMSTYNRSWAQGGTAGYYALYSTNQENGYAYFVGATTTGVALNRLANITHSFTRIDIIAPQNDMVSLYKAKVKATTEFANPFSAFASFGSPITSSGNFVLPNNALPLVNCLVVGGGAGGGRHGGGGGGGGNIVKLTAFQAVGTTGVTIGGATGYQGSNAGATYFGNVYALGGGYGSNHNGTGGTNGNGGGGGGHGSAGNGGSGTVQLAATGLGNSGSPQLFGGNNGARASGGEPGGGGAGAGGSASANISTHARQGGPGHASDISGSTQHYSSGGGGGSHGSSPGNHGGTGWQRGYYGMGGHGGSGDSGGYDPGSTNSQGTEGGQGIVIVRYYIP